MKNIFAKIKEWKLVMGIKMWLNGQQILVTFKWLIAVMAGSLFPVWGSTILLKLLSQEIHFIDFIKHGEFALYSTAALAPALYLITKEKKVDELKMPFLDKNLCGTFIFILGGLAVLIFAGVLSVKNNQVDQNEILNTGFLAWSSLTIYALSILLLFFLTLADNILTNPTNPREMWKKGVDTLATNFDELDDEPDNQLEMDFDTLGDDDE